MLISLITLFGGYFALSSLYLFIFAVAAKRPMKSPLPRLSSMVETKQNAIAVFIPAYKEDAVIVKVAKAALEQDYVNYEVVVIADQLQATTLEVLAKLPITIITVEFEKSTKVKALKKAMKELPVPFDMAVVLDADNVMEQGFLAKINLAYNQGYKVIQGKRIAKNKQTNIALWDAVSEAINNQIYNLGQINLGFSARLVGSGMAFDYLLFQELIDTSTAIGGFDKELELKLLERGLYIHYLPSAQVRDEKVASLEVFKKQRTRWIAAQYFYLRQYWWKACKALVLKQNTDFFNKIIQMALPPRLLLPALLLIGTTISLFLTPSVAWIWASGLLLNITANLMALPRELWTLELLKGMLKLPAMVIAMLSALFKLKGANQNFIHTPHH